MGRWEPGSATRLQEAALELYGEHGYENTTVAEIAERAGVTERTFFRHFSDKREVLFSESTWLQELIVGAVIGAPTAASPFAAVAAALDQVGEMFEERRPGSVKRQRVIEANAELRERELIKLATLASALAEALHHRGVKEPAASLTAQTAIAVFRIAFERWTEPTNEQTLSHIMRDNFAELKTLTAD